MKIGEQQTLSIEDFSKQELERLEKQRQEAIKAKGGVQYLPSLKTGESRVQLQRAIPTDDNEGDSPRKIFRAKLAGDPETYAWTVGLRSPLYRELVKFLPQAPLWLKIVRVGEGKGDTRWSVE